MIHLVGMAPGSSQNSLRDGYRKKLACNDYSVTGFFKGSQFVQQQDSDEWAAGSNKAYWAFDVDIFDANENPLSCRDVTFSCVDADNPLLEQLLNDANTSVAAFEYGINEAIPHSKGGELLCPGNVISEGWIDLDTQNTSGTAIGSFIAGSAALRFT